MNKRASRCGLARCDLCRCKPRLFWSEKKGSIRKRFAYKRHVSSAEAILVTKYRGAFHPLAQQPMSIIGPDAARVHPTCDNATRVPGLLHTLKVSRRKVSPSHHAVRWHPVRHTDDQPASCTVCCRRVPSHSPSPSHTPCVPAGISALTSSTSALWRSSGKCPFGPWRTRQASGRALPCYPTWIIRATHPRPTTLPSMTSTNVCKAK